MSHLGLPVKYSLLEHGRRSALVRNDTWEVVAAFIFNIHIKIHHCNSTAIMSGFNTFFNKELISLAIFSAGE